MTSNNTKRRRINKETVTAKEVVTEDTNTQDSEFTLRESPLTSLIENSLHIKAIYHIFVVILLILLFNTVIYDLVERGKINVGINVVVNGFGDIRRGAKLWLCELMVALVFYPGLRIYATGLRLFRKYPAFYRIWSVLGIVGLISLQITLIAVPVWDLGKKHLALGSSAAVTCEMVSGVAHEVVLALSFGFFYPVLMMEFGVIGVLMLPLTAGGRRFPNAYNMIMWLCFFLGNGLLWSLYTMEYFARQNCPPSENDSFFIPKSWSCPKIILKPDWTFQNPFDVIN